MPLNDLFLKVFGMSVTASWVILATLVLRLFLRPKKYAYALWGATGLRLICPFGFSSVLSLFNLKFGGLNLTMVPTAEYDAVQPRVVTGIPAANVVINGSMPQPNPMASINPMQIYVWLIGVVWCVGMGAMVLYAVVSALRLRRRMADAVLLEGNVFQSEKVQSPFILGIFRPKIYIPYGLEGADHVLAHEGTHLRRGDHMVKPLAFLILTVHWVNPLAWLAFSLMCRDMELSCDEAVLGKEGNGKEYSQTLLAIAAGRRFPSPSPLAFGEGDVKKRIRHALKWKKPMVWMTTLATVLCVLAIAVLITDPVEKKDAPFGEEYRAEEVIYQNPLLSILHTPETMPRFVLTEDRTLYLNRGTGDTYTGVFEETELTEENFDGFYFQPDADTGELLRRENRRTWKLGTEDGEHAYHLLEQKNGDLILTFGGIMPPNKLKVDGSLLWAVKLTEQKNGGSRYNMTDTAIRDAFAAETKFAACEELSAVAVTDGAYGLKGVVHYADEEGNHACFAFWKDDIWYTVKLGEGELFSPGTGGAMSYREDGKVQLILEDAANGSRYLYTVGWSPTEEGHNFTAASERIELPLESNAGAGTP